MEIPGIHQGSKHRSSQASTNASTYGSHEEILIADGPVHIGGHLDLPAHPEGVVVFAHGSGSSRFSTRNNYVAGVLRDASLGTLLIDLLTPDEDLSRANRFDIELLTRRLDAAVQWVKGKDGVADLPVGLFGASTGAAAALRVAAQRPADIAAVVSRGGRPDMTGQAELGKVQAPTLLIVGGLDGQVIALNQVAADAMQCKHRIEIVPGATHLFEEPGTLEQVAGLASRWLVANMAAAPAG
ncbi:dienelactone hydrolase family protein [Lacisediminimonas profundi]|uniref:dienelactone hydrolase family protein n=1 Tax=Lacisediminimonas profundi TaxID=2603856 RepID=UPI00124B3C62|nr:alpha/beta family hydrolase [Lacisediminimonas profundi]